MKLRSFFLTLLLSWGVAQTADANPLVQHFLGDDHPVCLESDNPVVVVTDVSRSGEIDDSLALLLLAHLEQQGCTKVVKIISIFGNEQQSTAQSHDALLTRLDELGLHHWRERVLRGPDHPVTARQRTADLPQLRQIRRAIQDTGPVTILELGPLTVSARLLMGAPFMSPRLIRRIIAVGGLRSQDALPGFMRDLNVALDIDAVNHLVEHYSGKLSFVTYATGNRRDRYFRPELIPARFSGLRRQAAKRGQQLAWLGFHSDAYPVWDPLAVSLLTETDLSCRYWHVHVDWRGLHLYRRGVGKRVWVCL